MIVTLANLQKSPRNTAIEKDNRLGFITFIPFVYKSTEEIGIFIFIIFILSFKTSERLFANCSCKTCLFFDAVSSNYREPFFRESTKRLYLSHTGGYFDGHKSQRFSRIYEREQAKL